VENQAVQRFVRALPLIVALASPVSAQDLAPAAAIGALRDRFEAEILALEAATGKDEGGFLRAAIDIAERVYGSNWDAVRAEAQRSLAALPTIDLGPYERLEPVRPFAGLQSGEDMLAFLLRGGTGSKWAFAAMRFWDAGTVGSFLSGLAPPPGLDRSSSGAWALKQGFVPMRVYRGRLNGADVLAVRNWRSLVVAPYSLSVDGLILPDLAGVRIYPLQN